MKSSETIKKNGFDEKYFIHFRIVRILCERGYT